MCEVLHDRFAVGFRNAPNAFVSRRTIDDFEHSAMYQVLEHYLNALLQEYKENVPAFLSIPYYLLNTFSIELDSTLTICLLSSIR